MKKYENTRGELYQKKAELLDKISELRDELDGLNEELEERENVIITVSKINNCWIYGVELDAYTYEDYSDNSKVFVPHFCPSETHDLSEAWEEVELLGDDICKDLEAELIQMIIEDYAERYDFDWSQVIYYYN